MDVEYLRGTIEEILERLEDMENEAVDELQRHRAYCEGIQEASKKALRVVQERERQWRHGNSTSQKES